MTTSPTSDMGIFPSKPPGPKKGRESLELYSSDGDVGYLTELDSVISVIEMIRKNTDEDFSSEELVQALRERPIKTIEELYSDFPETYARIAQNPLKLNRFNQLTKAANACSDPTIFKQIVNEARRVVAGKEVKLFFLKPEFHPDLLVI